jgi:hypothetical protein
MRVNSHLYGDQYAPRISSIGLDYLITWTSLGQDGSREGVYGQTVHEDGSLTGGEFPVNTTTFGQQMQPVVTSDGAEQFLVIWTSFTFGPKSFDLFAQRYINVSAILQAMSAPFVWEPFVVTNNVYQPQLVISWPALLGISISNYEVYVNGSGTPMAVTTSNQWMMTSANGLTAGSTNSFQLDYVTTDGRHSPLSPSASGATWGGLNWGGIPFEWMQQYYGAGQWPAATAKLAVNGPTLLQVFLTGGNPNVSSTWLVTSLTPTPEGMFLSWNTQPGATYQVLVKTSMVAGWSNLGAPRFAAGYSDSIFVGGSQSGFYQIMLLR